MAVKTYRVSIPAYAMQDMPTEQHFLCIEAEKLPKERDALWALNLTRRINGLPELKKLPKGTQFTLEPKYRS